MSEVEEPGSDGPTGTPDIPLVPDAAAQRGDSAGRELEATLRETEEHLRLAIESADIGTWDFNPITGTLRWSDRCKEILGVEPDTVITYPRFLNQVHPDDRGRVAAAVDATLDPAGSGRYDIEFRAVCGDGTTRWIIAKGRAFFEGAGESRRATRFIGTVIDNTGRHEADTALRASEARYQMVARATDDVIWDWDLRTDDVIWNEALHTQFGYPPELRETGANWWSDRVHPADRERVVSGIEEVIAGADQAWSAEYRYRLGDGRYAVVHDRGYVVRDERGRALRMIGAMADITARRTAAEHQRYLSDASAILASSLDYRTTLAQLAHLIVPQLGDWCTFHVLHEDGELELAAAAHADPERLLVMRDHGDRYTVDPEGADACASVIRTGRSELRTSVPDSYLVEVARDAEELELLRGIGIASQLCVPMIARGATVGAFTLGGSTPERELTASDQPLAEELGRRAAMAVDNARLYEAALAANEAKSSFLATMSHELRTPLTAIIGYEELLADGISGPITEEQQRQLRRIKTSAFHLLAVIDEILTFSRVEARREVVRREPVDAAEALDEAAALAGPLAAEKGLEVAVRPPAKRMIVETDPGKLRQILINLLTNAVKFTDRGTVWLAASVDGQLARFEVRDTGIGIAPEHLERIFDPFWQVEQHITRVAGGTGLGLSVSRQLARLLGGELTVESTRGQGSTFRLTLPRIPADDDDGG